MAKHKNMNLNVDGYAHRGTKGTVNITHTSLSMEVEALQSQQSGGIILLLSSR